MSARSNSPVVDGALIRTLRERHGWSLEALGGRVGITRKGMSKIELTGSTSITRVNLIAAELGVAPAALMPGVNVRPRVRRASSRRSLADPPQRPE